MHGGRTMCNHEGCNNFAVKRGVCWRHGAKHDAKICSEEGCTNIAVKRGTCVRHGAKTPAYIATSGAPIIPRKEGTEQSAF